MRSHRKPIRISLLITFAIAITTMVAMLFGQGSSFSVPADQQERDSLDNQIPVAIFAASDATDPIARDVRQARSSRYVKRRPQPIYEFPNGIEELPLITHWDRGISALPSNQSDAVVIGKVIDARAYLSEDKTSVYSEFTVNIKETLKVGSQVPIKPDDSITIEREGGAVLFPSGRVQKYRIANQAMPRIGRKYVFFLNRNDLGQDFSIITAYELRKGRILPLDNVDQFAVYKGAGQSAFLNAVRDSSKGGRNQ